MRTRRGSRLDDYRRDLLRVVGTTGELTDEGRSWARARFWRRFVLDHGRVDLRAEPVLDRLDGRVSELGMLNLNGNPGKVT